MSQPERRKTQTVQAFHHITEDVTLQATTTSTTAFELNTSRKRDDEIVDVRKTKASVVKFFFSPILNKRTVKLR